MTGNTSLVKGIVTGYTEVEKRFIYNEFVSLMDARQEEYSNRTLREWVKSFFEAGYSANIVCKRIKASKGLKVFGKLTYSDFVNVDITELKDIVPVEINPEYYYALLTCKECGKSTSIYKKDLYIFKNVVICEHKILSSNELKELSTQVTANYFEIII